MVEEEAEDVETSAKMVETNALVEWGVEVKAFENDGFAEGEGKDLRGCGMQSAGVQGRNVEVDASGVPVEPNAPNESIESSAP